MCKPASSALPFCIQGQFPNMNLLFLFSFADASCPEPPKIENGYVEHSVRFQCKTYYKLRTAGDGKAWTNASCPSTSTGDGARVTGRKGV